MDAITHTILVCIIIYIAYRYGQHVAYKDFNKFLGKAMDSTKKKPDPFFTRRQGLTLQSNRDIIVLTIKDYIMFTHQPPLNDLPLLKAKNVDGK